MDTTTIGITVLVAGIALLFALLIYAGRRLSFGQPKGEGYAPGWQVRCPKCGLTVDGGKAGLIRVSAAGSERRWGRCSHCRASRWLIVEPMRAYPAPDADFVASHRG